MSDNLELPLGATPAQKFGSHEPELAAEWLVALLDGRATWTTAADILRTAGLAVTEDAKRWLRLVRAATHGRVLGGPGFPGYRHVRTLTSDEYQHWRNAMLAQCDAMKSVVIAADKEFFGRATA